MNRNLVRWAHRAALGLSVVALNAGAFAAGAAENPAEHVPTVSPIKHVIVVIGENASFDHVFATYQPQHGQSVWNLLSLGIINADGTPGPNFSQAQQFSVSAQSQYFINAPVAAKTVFTTLPPPGLEGVPTVASDIPVKNGGPPPFATVAAAIASEPSQIEPADQILLTTGASGLTATSGPDTRILDVTSLPSGPFQPTKKNANGQGLSYDSYTEDTFHRFFQMWQQYDCGIEAATTTNPSGCRADLLPFVITTFAGAIDGGEGTSMSFLNVQTGDAPYLKSLAEKYTLADNYHQAIMGGTGSNHHMMMTGDQFYFSDGKGNPLPPPLLEGVINQVANPNPLPGTNNEYTNDPNQSLGNYVNCSDPTQPGVAQILNYLASLPYHPKPNCAPNTFYLLNNLFPGFHANGALAGPTDSPQHADGSDLAFVPPQTVPTVGDALNAKNISWTYYGDGLGHAAANDSLEAIYCPICDPMQYTTSTMATEEQRAAHLKDAPDLFADIANGNVPAVAFVKPSGFVDGHPQTSKLDLFESFLRSIVDKVQGQAALYADTVILVTWDEGGGFYDSGFIQPVDFFGDAPRVPLIAISPFSNGGKIVHSYYDHASVLKFIEHNWNLPVLSDRSRDNLPNPIPEASNPYIPTNMPAIGDLFEMFNFHNNGIILPPGPQPVN
ncbi:MAG: alkaline phosphatase family protein [Aliidongia sp.]